MRHQEDIFVRNFFAVFRYEILKYVQLRQRITGTNDHPCEKKMSKNIYSPFK